MKLLFDLLPIILFFVAYKVAGIYAATGVAIAASVVQIVWLRLRRRPIEPMQWTSLGIIVVFGGLTLFLRDETFIKWKPTVLYAVFALTLVGARLLRGINLIKVMLGKQVRLPEPVWGRLDRAWTVFFVVQAVLNIVVAYGFSTDVWVNFKLFGAMGLTLLFVVGQAVWLGRHVQEDGDAA
jgi:intracellular septation protein